MTEFDDSAFALAQRLREMEAVASVGSWEWHIATDEVRWSEQLFEIFGLKPEEFDATFEGYLSRVHPEDRVFARETIERGLATRTSYAADYRIVLPNGAERWIQCRGRVMVDDADEPVRLIGTCQDITEQRRVFDVLVDHATTDPLTGLLNRWIIVDRIRHVLERVRRYGSLPAVLFIDLDGLKRVNDNLGHGEGDAALRRAADALRASVRECDSIGRYGGDEFVAICEDVNAEIEGSRIAHRIVDRLRFSVGAAESGILITASVGVTTASRDDSVDQLIARADGAMYEAKQRGGGRIVVLPAPGGT